MAAKKKKAKAKKKAKTKAKKSTSASKTLTRKEGTIGHLIIKLLERKNTNEEILEAVVKKFPNCTTTIASVAWHRNKVRQTDKQIPTNRFLKSKKKK